MTIAVLEALTFGLGHLVAAAQQAGQQLCLLTGNRDIYRHELARLAEDELRVIDVDTHDVARCTDMLKAVPDLEGLINFTDTWMVPAADLAATFGLPGTDPAIARRVRDKRAVRSLLHARGLSRGPAVAVSPHVALAGIVHETVGMPAVLKDSAGTGSRNVWLARNAEQLDEALTEAGERLLLGELFAEPFLAGPLYSAETLSWDGQTRLLGVTGRLLSPRWFGREELLSFPVELPDPEHAVIDAWVARVLAAAGHRQGFAHVEFAHTTYGPELVEINARLGGCLAGEAMCRSLGTNIYAAMIEMALGQRPSLLDPATGGGGGVSGRSSATALVYPERVGTFQGVTGVEELPSYPGVPEWYPTKTPGTPVEDLADQRACVGLVFAEGATTEIAIYHALTAARAIGPVMSDQR